MEAREITRIPRIKGLFQIKLSADFACSIDSDFPLETTAVSTSFYKPVLYVRMPAIKAIKTKVTSPPNVLTTKPLKIASPRFFVVHCPEHVKLWFRGMTEGRTAEGFGEIIWPAIEEALLYLMTSEEI